MEFKMNEVNIVELMQQGNQALAQLSKDLIKLDVDSVLNDTRESIRLQEVPIKNNFHSL